MVDWSHLLYSLAVAMVGSYMYMYIEIQDFPWKHVSMNTRVVKIRDPLRVVAVHVKQYNWTLHE